MGTESITISHQYSDTIREEVRGDLKKISSVISVLKEEIKLFLKRI